MKAGDKVICVAVYAAKGRGVTGVVKKVQRRAKSFFGDRLFIVRDDGIPGSGPNGEWVSNADCWRVL